MSPNNCEDLSAVDLWTRRFCGVETMLELIQQEAQQSECTQGALKIPLVNDILMGLSAFARDQFDFLHQVFQGSESTFQSPKPEDWQAITKGWHDRPKILEPQNLVAWSRDAWRDFVLDITLQRVVLDGHVLDTLLQQRSRACRSTNSLAAKRLRLADRLALDALSSVDDRLLAPQSTDALAILSHDALDAITYISVDNRIRIVPYAQVAIISLPASILTVNQDLLAIPHEVGHYIYWNLGIGSHSPHEDTRIRPLLDHNSFRTKDLESRSADGMDPWRDWYEEIFADVVAYLIAGPIAALSLQGLLKSYVAETFLSTDWHHPIPAIRPFVYVTLFDLANNHGSEDRKIRASDLAPLAGETDVALEEAIYRRWLTVLQNRGVLDTSSPGDGLESVVVEIGGVAFHLNELYSKQCQLVREIYTLLKPRIDGSSAIFTNQRAGIGKWQGMVDEAFHQWCEHRKTDVKVEALLDVLTNLVEVEWTDQFDDVQPPAFLDWTSARKKIDINIETAASGVAAGDWLRIFEFAGWTTGPAGHGKAH